MNQKDIEFLEDTLRLAMEGSNIEVLTKLIADDLLFANHLGIMLSKEDDLDMHRSGRLIMHKIDALEQQIKIHNDVAIVSALMNIRASFGGKESFGKFRFTRVWTSLDGKLQVVAGHVCLAA